jgi:phage terminase small subunit
MPGTATSGGRGTRVKTRAQHELDGTFRKDKHGDLRNPEPEAGRPNPPAELDSDEQREWDRFMWAFEDMGMLHKVDLFAVFQCVKLWVEIERVGEQQSEARAGLRVLESNLSDIQAEDKVQLFSEIVNLHKIVSKCTDQLRAGRMAMRQYLVEFGLTPASRGRIKLTNKAEVVDELTEMQQARPSMTLVG